MATLELDLQIAGEDDDVPEPGQMEKWLSATLQHANYHADVSLPIEITIRIVEPQESQELNATYRHKNNPTNVLSFPFESPDDVPLQLLGDLVICAAIVKREAQDQGKSLESHWAHMVIHGCLHLLGFDHMETEDTEKMETLEIAIMADLGYSDPYVSPVYEHTK